MDAAAKWVRENGGRASFEEFMEAALFDPQSGYYSQNIRAVGRRGDFTTSPMLEHGLQLPAAIAAWLCKVIGDDGLPWNIIELGGGDGSMADAVLSDLGWWKRQRVRYHIVDVSEPLVCLQKQKLRRYRSVHWHADIQSALDACDGKAAIFSNEFVDAFPATILRYDRQSDQWRKAHLVVGGDNSVQFEFSSLPREELPDSSVLHSDAPWPDGQIVEIHDSYQRWLESWIDDFKNGHFLTIDYGDRCPHLYYRRPNGTLRGFFHHIRSEFYAGVVTRMGHQDITADVNFTDIANWGESVGLHTIHLETQDAFVREMTIASTTHMGSDPHHAAMLEEIGQTFQVLWQERRS